MGAPLRVVIRPVWEHQLLIGILQQALIWMVFQLRTSQHMRGTRRWLVPKERVRLERAKVRTAVLGRKDVLAFEPNVIVVGNALELLRDLGRFFGLVHVVRDNVLDARWTVHYGMQVWCFVDSMMTKC
jgi:hypothetical protein